MYINTCKQIFFKKKIVIGGEKIIIDFLSLSFPVSLQPCEIVDFVRGNCRELFGRWWFGDVWIKDQGHKLPEDLTEPWEVACPL